MIISIYIFFMDCELLLDSNRLSSIRKIRGERVQLEEGNFDVESSINSTGPVHTVKPTADCMRKCKVHVLRVVFCQRGKKPGHPLANAGLSLLIGAVVKCIRS